MTVNRSHNYKPQLFNDAFQNWKRYAIPKAQLIIADIPYNVGVNAYGSNPSWYVDGDRRNGESELAGKSFFYSDGYFNLSEFMHFNSRLLRKDSGKTNDAPCLIVFSSAQQQDPLIELAKQSGLKKHLRLYFIKQTSPQVLKANMRIVGATEVATLFYREKLPKFRNDGRMILDWFHWDKGGDYPHVHPTQKPVRTLKKLIEVLTDPGDVVIDPVAGSGSTLRAAAELGRRAYGFEYNRKNFELARDKMLAQWQPYKTDNNDLLSFIGEN